MSWIKVRRRSRIAALLVVSLGVVATAGAVTGTAQSVPPTGDCKSAVPAGDLAALEDQEVTGYTVEEGTTPEPFRGTVIGVLTNGIGAGKDMLMVELRSDALTRAGGVWSGMSGSPVYDGNDDLVGAVAYGLSFGPSMVAGVTPYDYMDDYMSSAAPAARVAVGPAEASRIAAESVVTSRQASHGFTRLPMPLSFSGGGAMTALLRRSAQAPPHGPARRYIEKRAIARHGASALAPTAPGDSSVMVAGGNLAATIAYGDVTAGGVGTVTSVCGNRVVGFGHPMRFTGRTSLTMHPASAVLVQPDSMGAPFKVANIQGPVGTITDDRATGLSGEFDVLPDTMRVTSELSYLDRSRTGETYVSIPGANAEITFYQQLVNHDAVFDGIGPGSELQTWTISGTNAGTPFSISHTDRFASDSDITFESPWDVADAVWALSAMPGVVVDQVTINGQIQDAHPTWRIRQLWQNRGGTWVTIGRRQPAIVRAGGSLRLRMGLASSTGTTTMVSLALPVPVRSQGSGGFLEVAGGGSSGSWLGGASTVAELRQALSSMAPNDAVEGHLILEGRRQVFERHGSTRSTDQVVLGRRQAMVLVR